MVFNFRFIDFTNPPEENHPRRLKRYSFHELKAATSGFSSKNLVGRGGYGKVYRGQLEDGSFVAVKRTAGLRSDRKRQLQREAEISSMLTHQNLVRLLGICTTWKEILLVYPYMPKGSLAMCLKGSQPPIDWPARKRIALGAAKGLAHLHDHCGILHGDVKTANILLDERFKPVITDFGMSQLLDRNSNVKQPPTSLTSEQGKSSFQRIWRRIKPRNPYVSIKSKNPYVSNGQAVTCWHWKRNKPKSNKTDWPLDLSMPLSGRSDFAEHSSSHRKTSIWDWSRRSTNGVCGTIGYIAPEHFITAKYTDKHDVYAYGVTLLELISGGRVSNFAWFSNGILQFQDWVKRPSKDIDVETLVDPCLQGNYNKDEVRKTIMLAQLCLQYNPDERPRMTEVVGMLEDNSLVERWEEWQEEIVPGHVNSSQCLNIDAETDSTSYYSMSSPDNLSTC